MEMYNLLVLDAHEGYANRLRMALEQARGGDAVRVFWARDLEMVNDIRANYTLHAAILSEKWQQSFQAQGAIVIPLKEARADGDDDSVLVRGDPVEQAAVHILSRLENHTRIIGVTGVGGGCGKTTVAMALAHQFARRKKKVFFLSLESYMARSPFTATAAVGLAEVLVALDVAEGVEKTILDACVRQPRYPGIDAFAVSEFNVDRSEVSADDARQLLGALKRMNRWDVIVVDLDGRMDDVLFEVWQLAARMVLAVPCTQIGQEKLSYAERELAFRQRRGEAELQKLVPVLNFCDSNAGGFSIFGKDIRLGIQKLGAHSAGFSSIQWSDALRQKAGLELFRGVYEEVAR